MALGSKYMSTVEKQQANRASDVLAGRYQVTDDPLFKSMSKTLRGQAERNLQGATAVASKTGLPGISASYLLEQFKQTGADAILNVAKIMGEGAGKMVEAGSAASSRGADRQLQKEISDDQLRVTRQGQKTALTGQLGSSAMSSAATMCCFIVAEGEGIVTSEVRRVRNFLMYYLGMDIAIGYIRLALWLVPLMRKHKIIHILTRALLTKPISWYSTWRVGGGGLGFLVIPWGLLWLVVFKYLGSGKRLNIYLATRLMVGV